MPDILSLLYIFGLPFLIGLFAGRGVGARGGWLAFLGLLPALYLLVQSELHGTSCAGGTCIADGFALIFALLLAAACLGYLAGQLLSRFRRSAPGAAATGKQMFRWLLVGVIVVMIAKIAIIYAQGAALRHAREAAEVRHSNAS